MSIQQSINQAVSLASVLGTQSAGYKARQERKQLTQDIKAARSKLASLQGTADAPTSAEYQAQYDRLRQAKALGLDVSNKELGTMSWRATELAAEEMNARDEQQAYLQSAITRKRNARDVFAGGNNEQL